MKSRHTQCTSATGGVKQIMQFSYVNPVGVFFLNTFSRILRISYFIFHCLGPLKMFNFYQLSLESTFFFEKGIRFPSMYYVVDL